MSSLKVSDSNWDFDYKKLIEIIDKCNGDVMKNYSELSDFEINKAVAYHIGLRTVEMAEDGEFNPCNNPSDAWPIICESLISITPHYKLTDESEEYIAHSNEWVADNVMSDGKSFRYKDINPLRAAMIVYMMMKDNENA